MSTIDLNLLRYGGPTTENGVTQCPFDAGSLDTFFDTGSGCQFNRYRFISKERLIDILNKITQETEGRKLLNVLKANLETGGKKVSFIVFYEDEESKELKELNDVYAFNSEFSLSGGSIVISIKDSPHKPITRFAFDGQKIVECRVDNIDPEVYYISHELVHVVSFLESGIADNIAWKERKEDWVNFLNTERMNPIKALLYKNPDHDENDKIRTYFKKFFENTEEARNLLGFITENKNRTLMGEFCFFNERNNFFLPTYLDKISDLNPEEINFLRQIGESLGIQFQARATAHCVLQ